MWSLATGLVTGLVLHGAFHHDSVVARFYPHSRFQKIVFDELARREGRSATPAVLLCISPKGRICGFEHYNYTIHRCSWPSGATLDKKADTLRNVRLWLNSLNQTLDCRSLLEDDMLAWHYQRFFDE